MDGRAVSQFPRVRIEEGISRVFIFRPRGLSPSREYRITLDNTGDSLTLDGIQLMQDGLPFRLEFLGQSELIMMKPE